MNLLIKRSFTIDGREVTIAAAIRGGDPLVFLVLSLDNLSELSSISTEYPMKSAASAKSFVEKADEDVAKRGADALLSKFYPFVDQVNNAFSQSATKSKIMGLTR